MKKEKKVKSIKEKEKTRVKVDKALAITLLICVIICLILSLVLYLNGINKMMPIILVFVLGILSALSILLLSRETINMKKTRDKKIANKINA